MASYIYPPTTADYATTTAWTNWNAAATSTAATTTDTWTYWNSSGTTFITNNVVVHGPTPEERAEARRQWDEVERKAKEAQKRAEALLLEHLNEEQKESLSRNERFRVRGSKGGVYDICMGSVYQYEADDTPIRRPLASVCIHSSEHVPEADNMLAKKLMIETDEDEFRRIGNFSRY